MGFHLKTTFHLCSESWSPTSVILTVFYIFIRMSLLLPFLQYINVLKSVLFKQTTNPLWTSYSSRYSFILFLFKDLWRTILRIVFFSFSQLPPPPFFFSLLKSDFSSYCFCETTLTKIRGGILIVKSSGHFSVHLLFHLSLALDVDSCSHLSKLSLVF